MKDAKDPQSTFFSALKSFPVLQDSLMPGASKAAIDNVEKAIGNKLPGSLQKLYRQHNGQKEDSPGIFKLCSGYDKYARGVLLTLTKMVDIWKKMLANKELDVFENELLPFAVDQFDDLMDDVVCIHAVTGEVFLLWTLAYDWTLPVEWQTARFKRATTLDQFLSEQVKLYR